MRSDKSSQPSESTRPIFSSSCSASRRKTTFYTSLTIENLKVEAALKLWADRGYQDIKFEAPLTCNGKTVFAKVLAQDERGVVGVECASSLRLARMCKRIKLLRSYLPVESWLVVVFPFGVDERVRELAHFADENWVTSKHGTVEQIMFATVFQRD